jgi:hypothetical protein
MGLDRTTGSERAVSSNEIMPRFIRRVGDIAARATAKW